MSLASRKLIQATAGAAGAADASDDDFANVVLLLDGDGTSGDDNNTFTDSSTNGFTVTKSGDVVQGSFSPYGDNWSVYFENNTSFMQSDTAIAVSTDNFTIEMWVWVTETDVRFCSQNNTGGTNFYFGTNATGNLRWDVPTGTNVNSNISSGGIMDYVMPLNQWVHVAAVREGTGSNQFKMYADGVLVAQSRDNDDHGTGRKINIAGGRGDSANYDGYISNFRFVVGSAVYTSAFTPPIEPLTNITNTKLLACQSNRFIDNSATNDTFTLDLDTGTPEVTPFSPFKDDDARDITTDGGSAYFDGSDLLTTSISTIGSGDLTIEFWAMLVSDTTGRWVAGTGTGSGTFQVGAKSNSKWSFFRENNVLLLEGTTSIKELEWYHVAVSRSGSTAKLFVNGVEEASASNSTNFTATSLGVGGYSSSNASVIGFVSDFRIVIGSGLYTSDFTPPTAPLTAVTNTDFLLNFQDAGIYDLSGINNIDTVGNAQIDTAVKKYGTGSMEFDGSGDYLTIPSTQDVAVGSGDFTIECWANFSVVGSGNGQGLFQFSNGYLNSQEGKGPGIGINNSNGQWYIYYGAGTNLNTTLGSSPSADTWYHVAFVRTSGVIKIFIDGTQTGSDISYSGNYTDTHLTIGGWYSVSFLLTGYIDDFRITKGVARYTADFTPPTDALPKF
jgi:hypothetical protein